jgi:hypothetical protein
MLRYINAGSWWEHSTVAEGPGLRNEWGKLDKVMVPVLYRRRRYQRPSRSLDHQAVANLPEDSYQGSLYLVSLTRDQMDGILCCASITDIEGSVDQAILLDGRDRTGTTVRECVIKGVRGYERMSA